MKRRDFLLTGSTGALMLASTSAQSEGKPPMQTPWDWTAEHGLTNGLKVDSNPLENEFEKFPRCTYCGMVRKMWSHSRHLIVYDDDSVDGTCSIHCAAISLSLNLDRGPKVIYAGDAGAEGDVKPLADTADMTYVINPAKMGTMTKVSKLAYADKAVAEGAAKAAEGTSMVGFDEALTAAYLGMAQDTIAIRKRRAEKRARAAANK